MDIDFQVPFQVPRYFSIFVTDNQIYGKINQKQFWCCKICI